MNIDDILIQKAFSLKLREKRNFFKKNLFNLFKHHEKNCNDFKIILKGIKFSHSINKSIENYPFLPIRLFKNYNLYSVNQNKILKQLSSSGTTSKNLSKIYLDETNSINQIKALKNIFTSFVGKSRLPMLILDAKLPNTNKTFNAKYAGVMGFSLFGKDNHYALNERLEIDFYEIKKFFKKYGKSSFLVFGFTFDVWNFFNTLKNKKYLYDFRNGTLIHGGGWKKLQKNKVSEVKFKKYLSKNFNFNTIINYYGMIEQTGSIFFQCKYGYFHSSVYSDIIIRDKNFSTLPLKKSGIIQVLSLIPTSYPGNSILTEDRGKIMGIDDCRCGRKGKYFVFDRRVEDAELRGCSDSN